MLFAMLFGFLQGGGKIQFQFAAGGFFKTVQSKIIKDGHDKTQAQDAQVQNGQDGPTTRLLRGSYRGRGGGGIIRIVVGEVVHVVSTTTPVIVVVVVAIVHSVSCRRFMRRRRASIGRENVGFTAAAAKGIVWDIATVVATSASATSTALGTIGGLQMSS